jgi:uncharacterized protein YggT (Ycf19 family)
MFRTRNIITSVINFIFTIAEIFLLLRLLLKLLSANQEAAFVRWLYQTSKPLLAPFEGMFPTVVEQGVVIEFSTLFAVAFYAIAGYLLVALIDTIYFALQDRRT